MSNEIRERYENQLIQSFETTHTDVNFFYLGHVGLILWDWILPNMMLMHWPPKNFRNWP